MFFVQGGWGLLPPFLRRGEQPSCFPPSIRETLASQTFHFVPSLQASLPPNLCEETFPLLALLPLIFVQGRVGDNLLKTHPNKCLDGAFAPPLLPSIRENSASQIIQVRLADITKGFSFADFSLHHKFASKLASQFMRGDVPPPRAPPPHIRARGRVGDNLLKTHPNKCLDGAFAPPSPSKHT